jgi:hypothetical protein
MAAIEAGVFRSPWLASFFGLESLTPRIFKD